MKYLIEVLLTACLYIAVVLQGCHSASATDRPKPVHHMASVSRHGVSYYVDRVSNRAVMQEEDTVSGQSSFCSYLAGRVDSAIELDKKQLLAKEKYFEYDMQADWAALVHGDTLRPTFFQARPSLDRQKKEWIIVFEVPKGTKADTLIYRDSFETRETEFFVLNRK